MRSRSLTTSRRRSRPPRRVRTGQSSYDDDSSSFLLMTQETGRSERQLDLSWSARYIAPAGPRVMRRHHGFPCGRFRCGHRAPPARQLVSCAPPTRRRYSQLTPGHARPFARTRRQSVALPDHINRAECTSTGSVRVAGRACEFAPRAFDRRSRHRARNGPKTRHRAASGAAAQTAWQPRLTRRPPAAPAHVIVTGTPGPIRFASQVMSAVRSRTQPCEAAVPGVPPRPSRPWMPICPGPPANC